MSWRHSLAAGICALALAGSVAAAQPRHGISAFGDLKYPKDFPHFEYVNPDAPKGGRLSMIGTEGRITFDSFNEFIVKGVRAQGLPYLYDTLMARAWDEPDAAYGLLAHSAELADDRKSIKFYLRPEARFADGKPVTSADVVFSYETLRSKHAHPLYSTPLRDIASATAVDPHTVQFTFEGEQTRDLPQVIGQMPILAKHWYETNDFKKSGFTKPITSGPYEIADYKQGTYVTYKRRKDYWGWHLNVNKGRFNFDELRYEYFRERTAELEALKSGNYDLREEFTSRDWANAYDIPQVASGRMIRTELPDSRPSGTQGFFLNTRREKFKDPRVRKALDYAFDFEWTRKAIFYGAYERTVSYFENSDMRADGRPSEEELALLAPFKDKLPDNAIAEPYVPPVSNGSGFDRKLLRESRRLFKQAGFTFKGGKAFDAEGKPFSIEFLIVSPTSERILTPYVRTLEKIGISASMRRVDSAQYQLRLKTFDFDIVGQRYNIQLIPGPALRNFWGSKSATQTGSFNLAGIADPVVDALIEKVLAAKNRTELVNATRALDRVLRAGHYWISNWYNKTHRMAFWNKFGRPKVKPLYDRGVIQTWWFDKEKAAKLDQN